MKRTKLLALLAVIALVIAACGGGEGEGGTSTTGGGDDSGATTTTGDSTEPTEPPAGGGAGEGGEIILQQWQPASSLNPFLSGGTKELLASSLILEPLAEFDAAGELVPALAEEIPTVDNGGVAEDFTSITWTLKEGLVWSDGTPVTANDVVFTWEYCTGTTDCTQSSFFTGITSVEAVDDTTVQINFDAPQPFPYTAFVTYQSPVLQAAQFADCMGEAAITCTAQNEGPIGTGPYKIDEFRTNDTAVYSFNENYRGVPEGKPFFGSLTIVGGGDAEASARAVLQTDEADYGWNLQVLPDVLTPMEAEGNGVLLGAFASNVERIDINWTDPNPDLGDQRSEPGTTHPFLTDPVVYNALSMAIDRQALVDVGYGEFGGRATCNIWPADTATAAASTANDACLTPDPEGAAAALEEAGYVDSDGDGVRETPDGTPMSVLYQTSTNAVRQLNQDLVKAAWESIGIAVELKNIDAGVFFGGDPASPDTYQRFYSDVQMYTNGSGSPDAGVYMNNWLCDQVVSPANNFGGSNISRWCNEEFDTLYGELQNATDAQARKDLTVQLNDLAVQGGAIIPLIWRASVSAFGNDIQGVGDLNGWDSEYWNIEDWTRG
ncbi:MAG TPA: peptide ABC transporter substrate-binding protein [Acidimicrobiia bacterium]|jgi:peptide/nickel transport system substrate-binding protein|nr:peptide ABC transporter substrate-binding protein [Acidimicrobiia bacterium]